MPIIRAVLFRRHFLFPGETLDFRRIRLPIFGLGAYQAYLAKVQFGFSPNFVMFNFTCFVRRVPKMALSGFKEILSVETRNNFEVTTNRNFPLGQMVLFRGIRIFRPIIRAAFSAN